MTSVVDMRLRPPIPAWTDKAQYKKAAAAGYNPMRIGFPRPRSAEERSTELLIQEMDEAGIEWGVVMGRQAAPPHGGIPNDAIAEVLSQYPKRFVSFCGIDVSQDPAACVAEIDRCLKNPGFKGISIEPSCSVTPMHCGDRRLYPIYDHAQTKGVPIAITLNNMLGHMCGFGFQNGKPEHLYEPACDFPKLTFIICHAAWPWGRDLLGLAFMLPNIVVSPDLYGNVQNLPGADEYVKAANHYMGDRTLFGTAYPTRPLKESLESFNKWEFAPGVKEKVLGANALRIMNMA
jgi:predicted TIM-barrel fold metal-dependent hydrolase